MNMKEPETVSTVAGSEVYQIPLILAKNMGSVSGLSVRRQNVWHFAGRGSSIRSAAGSSCGKRVFHRGETYKAQELLALYIKKAGISCGKTGESCDT